MKPEAGWNPNSVKSETTDAYEHTRGRWPANLVLSHAPGCVCVGEEKVKGEAPGRIIAAGSLGRNGIYGESANRFTQASHADADGLETVAKWLCVEGCPVKVLGEQSGEGRSIVRASEDVDAPAATYGLGRTGTTPRGHADRGTAARFFTQLPPEEPGFLYCAKASRSERERGCEGMDSDERPDAHNLSSNACGRCGKRVKSNGSGDKGECGDLRETIKLPKPRNPHPTVKPVALMRWLCKLTKTPSGGIVLDPFGGSGTTGVAAVMEGREFIAVEQDPHYCEIARARIAHAREQVANKQPTLMEV